MQKLLNKIARKIPPSLYAEGEALKGRLEGNEAH